MRYGFISLILVLALAGCTPTRQEADSKLAKACKNAVKALSGPTDQVEFAKITFSFGKGQDNLKTRVVVLSAHLTYEGGEPVEKTYNCSFKEDWSLFGYRPEFYNMEKDGVQYGNFDGHIQGEMTDILKITEATTKELY